jgi:hypothetical protein
MRTSREVVFVTWCRLTGQDVTEVDAELRAAFLARPQINELCTLPYADLLDAAISAASRGTLPLDSWLRSTGNRSRPS